MNPTDILIPLTRLMRDALDRKPNPKLLRRWRAVGLLTPAGVRVKLAARKVGGRWCTTQAAWEAFQAAVNGDDLRQPELSPSKREMERQGRTALDECRALGCRTGTSRRPLAAR